MKKFFWRTRKFIKSIFMIFAGAIAALLCNGWLQYLDAQKDIEKIRTEIRANRDQIHKELDTFKAETDERSQAELKLLHTAVADRSDEQTKQFEELRKHRFSFAGFDTTAWDTAIARESVRFIDTRFLGPFSNVYNVQRGYTQEDVLRWRLQNVLASSERVAEFRDLTPEQATEIEHAIVAARAEFRMVQSFAEVFEKACDDAIAVK
jgi:hypothetical protein